MDWRNDESDHSSVENLKWDENDNATRTKKDVPSLGRNVRSQEVQVGIGMCKDIRKFTSALENLELETDEQDQAKLRTSDAQTNYFNDSEQEETGPVFRTREKSTFQLVLQGPEILNFQVRALSRHLNFARYEAFPGGHRALLEEGLSNVAVEVGETREEDQKDQSEGCPSFVSQGTFVA
ncbi:uncharacterized protein LOC105190988 isoform X1 [Harpegnathos saltator]|uniref:uncharacterized protein LOC105190988 isoform X1 n=1 Tax=Harpegnathos saltator TaxID=610380 RepID=UPI000948B70A|nr:uncharacterized protein LOC105190988 isoform X1 [Harpegnathos saltator]